MTRFEPKKRSAGVARLFSVVAAVAVLLVPAAARAAIDGEIGPTFSLTASAGYISIADGGSVYSWGYGTGDLVPLPGPTLIVTAGEEGEVTLTTARPAPAGNVSI